ncbi:ATP-binding protein [Micromonospora lupini]
MASKENVVFVGPPGTGKTHLSIAPGSLAELGGHPAAQRRHGVGGT